MQVPVDLPFTRVFKTLDERECPVIAVEIFGCRVMVKDVLGLPVEAVNAEVKDLRGLVAHMLADMLSEMMLERYPALEVSGVRKHYQSISG